jgi:hypothetical protein
MSENLKPLFDSKRCYRPDEVACKWNLDIKEIYKMIKDINDPLPAFRPTGKKALRIRGEILNAWEIKTKVEPLNE